MLILESFDNLDHWTHLFLDGEDYVGTVQEHIFPSGSTTGDTRCSAVSLISDQIFEGTERFFSVMESSSIIRTETPNISITIIDDDSKYYKCIQALEITGTFLLQW